MPQIIDVTYFQKANDLNIPLASETLQANPALQTPNSKSSLTNLCAKVEKSILLNALGLTIYKELQLALADINNPLYASYKKLVEGEEYDGKIWAGLKNEYSLIAYSIFEKFTVEANERLTGVGTAQGKAEKATMVSPRYKIANANQQFISKYQGGYLNEPIVTDNFVDWFGIQEEIEVSLYRYMIDKGYDMTFFRTYETLNSFGI